MKTAYSFIRWSTKKQNRENRDSKDRQLKSAVEWCKENECFLSKQTFIGAGESAFKGKHLTGTGALARFIQAVLDGTIARNSVLCVDSVDRFSRQEILDALEPFTRLLNLGIGIVFTGSPLRILLTRERVNKDPYLIQNVINDMIRSWTESAEKSRKVKSALTAMYDRLKKGKETTWHRSPSWFTLEDGKYILNAKAKTVERMADMILAGHSLRSVATKFNEEKLPTLRRDSQWSTTTVRKVLRSRTLLGELFGRKKFFPAVLDVDTFDKVQAVLNHNAAFNRGTKATFTNIFKGLAYCECGMSMNSVTQNKSGSGKIVKDRTKYRYFRCTTASLGKPCNHAGRLIHLLTLETEFFGNFLLKDPRALNASDPAKTQLYRDQAKAMKSIGEVDKKLQNAVDLLDSGLAAVQVKKKLQTLEAEKAVHSATLDLVNAKLQTVEVSPQAIDDLKKLLKSYLADKAAVIDRDTLKMKVTPSLKAYDDALVRLQESLKNETLRMQLRTVLPSLIGKVEVSTTKKAFKVFNHSGDCVYESLGHIVGENTPLEWA